MLLSCRSLLSVAWGHWQKVSCLLRTATLGSQAFPVECNYARFKINQMFPKCAQLHPTGKAWEVKLTDSY